ncbi:GNAT family N-acetyltransferase [Ureibacillus aquaedulcis]|uniref:GNAT family protein n=1 Tax=Ureibacillus aquaedulcis TaxID=3058421 RepID=A0ABT8GXG1_9BACL|nr:GNAT family protein [Ureibacillus sp. BA0131]MDN4495626.1 GNAT family protein [Ureibacillus sp. BA0131]
MGKLFYRSLQSELDELIWFMTKNAWDYHAETNTSEEQIVQLYNKGWYQEDRETIWIELANRKIGLIIIHDISDTIPLLDIRLDSAYRGFGYGREAVKWIVDYIFNLEDKKIRVEAYTRSDNYAMRKTLSNCGFVKEGYLRSSWENHDGSIHDSICYSMIRTDWENGVLTPIRLNDLPY